MIKSLNTRFAYISNSGAMVESISSLVSVSVNQSFRNTARTVYKSTVYLSNLYCIVNLNNGSGRNEVDTATNGDQVYAVVLVYLRSQYIRGEPSGQNVR